MKNDLYLLHYGVKGMKWGVRKDRTISSSERRRLKKEASIEKKRTKALDRRTSARYTYRQRKHLTDAELRQRINRLQMEKQLKDLSKSDGFSMVTISTGQQAARKALGYYGAKTLLNTYVPGAGDFVKVPKK